MLVPVILSGGAGTRLWPVSREGHPAVHASGRWPEPAAKNLSARRAPGRRGRSADHHQPRLLLSQQDEYAALRQREPRQSFLLEPFGRNTAPAILLALQGAKAHGDDAVMLVLPADHLIADAAGLPAMCNTPWLPPVKASW